MAGMASAVTPCAESRGQAELFEEIAGALDGRIDARVVGSIADTPYAIGILEQLVAFGFPANLEHGRQHHGQGAAWSMPNMAVSSWPMTCVDQSLRHAGADQAVEPFVQPDVRRKKPHNIQPISSPSCKLRRCFNNL